MYYYFILKQPGFQLKDLFLKSLFTVHVIFCRSGDIKKFSRN